VFVEDLNGERIKFMFPLINGLKKNTTKGCVAEYLRRHSQGQFSDSCLFSWLHLLVITYLSHLVWTLCDCTLLQKVSAYTSQIGNSKYQPENGVVHVQMQVSVERPDIL